MTKITIEDQIVSDFNEYFKLADRILAEKQFPVTFTIDGYLALVELIIEHAHWIIETYPTHAEVGEEIKIA